MTSSSKKRGNCFPDCNYVCCGGPFLIVPPNESKKRTRSFMSSRNIPPCKPEGGWSVVLLDIKEKRQKHKNEGLPPPCFPHLSHLHHPLPDTDTKDVDGGESSPEIKDSSLSLPLYGNGSESDGSESDGSTSERICDNESKSIITLPYCAKKSFWENELTKLLG